MQIGANISEKLSDTDGISEAKRAESKGEVLGERDSESRSHQLEGLGERLKRVRGFSSPT